MVTDESNTGGERVPIAEGAAVDIQTTPMSAPTIYVDGIKGVVVQAGVIKISFFEQVIDTDNAGKILGRHVVTLAMPNEQLAPIAKLLRRVADDEADATPSTTPQDSSE